MNRPTYPEEHVVCLVFCACVDVSVVEYVQVLHFILITSYNPWGLVRKECQATLHRSASIELAAREAW